MTGENGSTAHENFVLAELEKRFTLEIFALSAKLDEISQKVSILSFLSPQKKSNLLSIISPGWNKVQKALSENTSFTPIDGR